MDDARFQESTKEYFRQHAIPAILQSILSGLLIERPADPLTYFEERLQDLQRDGIDKVDCQTFIRHLHPYRDLLRLDLIRDESTFQKEHSAKLQNDSDDVSLTRDTSFFVTDTPDDCALLESGGVQIAMANSN